MPGSPETQGRQSMVGATLGGYRLVREIGRGGMGAVYLAEHSRIVRQAAVKVLLPGAAASPEAVQRFFAEARAASMIRHPGIIEVFDCDVDASETAFIVMELLQGRSLRVFIKEGLSQDLGALVDIGSQIAGAMAAAHAQGIVHRDLKPDNVFLCEDGAAGGGRRVKLLDFGIAKLLAAADGASLTTDGLVIGTPRYMSPEQCQNSREVGPATDVYSMGCILFEMACGRAPFQADSATALLIAHVSESPPRPALLNSFVPAALDALIVQMLAKTPDARPSSMEEVERRLQELRPGATADLPSEAALPDAPTGKADPTRTRPVPRPPSRRNRYALAVAGLLLAVALPAWILMGRAREARLAEARAARTRLESGLARVGEVPTPPACQTTDAETLVRLGSALDALQPPTGEADPGSATTRLETARPPVAEEWAMRARAHLAGSQDAEALTAAERALALCPDYAAARYLAGKAADRLGQRERAANEYRAALVGNDGFIPPRYNLALLQLKDGDSAGAAANLDEVIARRPDARAQLLRAQARLNTADLAGAEADLRDVLRREPTLADGWALLGTVHARRADHAQAMQAFCRAKELGSAAAAASCRE